MLSLTLLLSFASPAQQQLEQIIFLPSSQTDQQLGSSFLELGDVNGDGTTDVAIGSPGHLPTNGTGGSGLVEVFSGADGSLLYQVDPTPSVDSMLGSTLILLGDINQDSILDFAVGGGRFTPAYMISGANGMRLTSISINTNGFDPMRMSTIGDTNGDGLPEFAIGLHLELGNGAASAGRLQLHDGATGLLLQEVHGNVTMQQLGKLLCGPGDLNGDGIPDVVANSTGSGTFPSDGFTAFSGATLQPIYTFARQSDFYNLCDFDPAGDLNGDGVPDLLMSGYRDNFNGAWFQGVTRVLSGIDGATLAETFGPDFEDFGRSSTALGDMDGDGIPDFAVCDQQLTLSWLVRPIVRVISGRTGAELALLRSPLASFLIVKLSRLSDRDGDGRDELVIAIPEDQASGGTPGYLPGGEVRIYGLKP